MRYHIYHKTECHDKWLKDQKLKSLDKDEILASCQDKLDADGFEYSIINHDLLLDLLGKLHYLAVKRDDFELVAKEAFKDLDWDAIPESHKGRLAELDFLCQGMIENADRGSFFTNTDITDDVEYPQGTGLRDVAVPSLVKEDGRPDGLHKVYLQGDVHDDDARAGVMMEATKDVERIEHKEEEAAVA